LAATTLRNVLGTKNLGDILSERESIAQEMKVHMCIVQYVLKYCPLPVNCLCQITSYLVGAADHTHRCNTWAGKFLCPGVVVSDTNICVPDSKSRNISEVVLVRRWTVGVLGIWREGVGWVKGGANGVSLQAT
jgi:hypothetical protein